MLKLYGGQRSRATIVQWYLEECEIPYEFVRLDMDADEHRQPDFLGINPFGKVPAIVDGDVQLWESGAILLYLAEKHGPLTTLAARAQAAQWVLFANATLGPGLFVAENRAREAAKLLQPLQARLAADPFLTGAEFSVVDVAVGSFLVYAGLMLQMDFQDYPAIAAYVQRLRTRPGFAASIGQR